MRLGSKAAWSLAVAFCLALCVSAPLAAQTVTTGNITGTITDTQGGVLPGASVVATHTDTGTKYETVTAADGHFSILNVRVGEYAVTASMSGFKEQKRRRSSSAPRRPSISSCSLPR